MVKDSKRAPKCTPIYSEVDAFRFAPDIGHSRVPETLLFGVRAEWNRGISRLCSACCEGGFYSLALSQQL